MYSETPHTTTLFSSTLFVLRLLFALQPSHRLHPLHHLPVPSVLRCSSLANSAQQRQHGWTYLYISLLMGLCRSVCVNRVVFFDLHRFSEEFGKISGFNTLERRNNMKNKNNSLESIGEPEGCRGSGRQEHQTTHSPNCPNVCRQGTHMLAGCLAILVLCLWGDFLKMVGCRLKTLSSSSSTTDDDVGRANIEFFPKS